MLQELSPLLMEGAIFFLRRLDNGACKSYTELMEETWIPAYGCPGYEISDQGNFRSLKRTMIRSNGRPHTTPAKLLAPWPDSKGYLQVGPYIAGKRKAIFVHRIVFQSFVRPLKPHEQIDHINNEKTDNHRDNLQALNSKSHHMLTREREQKKQYSAGYKTGVRKGLREAIEILEKESDPLSVLKKLVTSTHA